jgi:hypothetical protein
MRDDALPEAYAISYIDIVGAVGYAVHLDPALSVGANIKVANRRFSTKRIAPDQFDSIIRELRRDFTTSVTGVSLDLGALYEFSHTGTDVGLSVQNIVPLQVVSSSVRADFLVSGIQDYDRDGNGDPIVTNRDTALVAAQQNARIEIPFELKTPLLVNVGTRQVINDRWDASLDVVDLAGQDIKFENALERVRLGTEYRLGTRDQFEVAVRAGLADLRPTFGIGLNIFRVLQLDAAYAFDNFLDENAIFAQARVGW